MADKRIKAMLSKPAGMMKASRKYLRIIRASRRPNLIGEQTDYNEGYVLPCRVNLVWEWAVEELAQTISKQYKEKTGFKPGIYVCEIADGAAELESIAI